MSIADPSGYRRNLSYDELSDLLKRQDENASKSLMPGMAREATRFVQSPYFERLKETVYEDMKDDRVRNQLVNENKARLERAQEATGLPANLMPKPPPGPPPGPDDDGGPDGDGGPGGSRGRTRGSGSLGRGGARGESSTVSMRYTTQGPAAGERYDRNQNRTRSPRRRGDDDDDEPMGGAGAVAIASTTAAKTQEVNEIKLQAELQRLEQEKNVGERRAVVAESVANMLYRERMTNPINSGIFHFGAHPQPPPPQPVVVNHLDANQVVGAMQQAMLGERRNLQDLMAHHGNSMRETIQSAVSSSGARSSTDPAPNAPDVPVQSAVKVDTTTASIRKKFNKNVKKVSFAGGATSPMPVPETVPAAPLPTPAVPAALTKKQKRDAIITARPLDQGPEVLIERGTKRDGNFRLEGNADPKRSRTNPSAALNQQRNTTAALAKEALDRDYATKVGMKRAATKKVLAKELQRGLDIISESKSKNPPRMDQFDLKRYVDDIYDGNRVEAERSSKRYMLRPTRAGTFDVTL